MNTKSLRFRMTLRYAGLNESLVKQARTIGDEILVDYSKRGAHYAVTEIDESYEPAVNARFIRVTREAA